MDSGGLVSIKKDCNRKLLGMYKTANAGHVASSLSCLDILIYLHFERMKPDDRFILSKGHAAAALYVVLSGCGRLPEEEIGTFYKDGTLLAAHPPCGCKLDGVPFGTGSLGHGLSLAAGIALSARYNRKPLDVYCVVSDGDCNEGSTWEAVMFAAQHKMKNLTVVVDYNRLQGFGRARDVLDLEPFADKWTAFGFETVTATDGNSFDSLRSAFAELDARGSDRPRCIIAHTIKGCGVSFMQDRMEWHYLPMSDEQYNAALCEMDL